MRLKSDLVMLIYGVAKDREGFSRQAGEEQFPPIDVSVVEGSIHIWMDIPDIGKEDIAVYIKNDMLVIEGNKCPRYDTAINPAGSAKKRKFLRMERRYQPFRRVLQLKKLPSAIQKQMADGVLHLILT